MPAAGNIAASVQGALASAGSTKPAGRTGSSALMSERPPKGGLFLFRASDDVAHRPLNVLRERSKSADLAAFTSNSMNFFTTHFTRVLSGLG
jgi:hypothetical protein